jgi:hypothetical protein
MTKWMIPVFALTVAALPAVAAPACYSSAEVQAEQVLRLHSELMVITVACRQGSMGEDLVRAYTGFTRNNINLLRDAEATMTAHYKKAYGGKGVDRLDRLRTLLANEFGQEIADKSAPVFCAQKRDKVLSLYHGAPATVNGEVLRVAGRSYEAPCGVRAGDENR